VISVVGLIKTEYYISHGAVTLVYLFDDERDAPVNSESVNESFLSLKP
jgi:hypothetical protein